MLLLVVERILRTLTEPYLRLFRRLLPTARIASVGIDVSALAGLIVLLILMRVLARL
jgi:YggT family protein